MKVRLMWDASSSGDVVSYAVFADDNFIASVPHTCEPSYEYKVDLPGDHYTLKVVAIDGMGRQSRPSSVAVRTGGEEK